MSLISTNLTTYDLTVRFRVLIKSCGSVGLNTCKMREQKMREYIAGVRVICGRKMWEWEIIIIIVC